MIPEERLRILEERVKRMESILIKKGITDTVRRKEPKSKEYLKQERDYELKKSIMKIR